MRHRPAALALAVVSAATLLIAAPPPSNAGSQAAGGAPDRVRWRIELDGDYMTHRPGVGPDGTIYVSTSNGKVHGVNPNGTLKWEVALGLGVGNIGPVSVASDGTIYVAGLVDVPGPLTTEAVFALNPDGSRKWLFDDTGTEQIIAGPNIGPDGNIYAVMEGYEGIGFFSLTPAGNLRFAVDSGDFSDYGSLGEEIVFSADTAYFAFENSRGLFAYRLDGNLRWAATLTGTEDFAPAIGPNGNIIVRDGVTGALTLKAFAPTGARKWTYAGRSGNVQGRPDVAPDNTVYVSRNLRELVALKPSGSLKWRYVGNEIFHDPVASPTNSMIFTGGRASPTGSRASSWDSAGPAKPCGGSTFPMSRDSKSTGRWFQSRGQCSPPTGTLRTPSRTSRVTADMNTATRSSMPSTPQAGAENREQPDTTIWPQPPWPTRSRQSG